MAIFHRMTLLTVNMPGLDSIDAPPKKATLCSKKAGGFFLGGRGAFLLGLGGFRVQPFSPPPSMSNPRNPLRHHAKFVRNPANGHTDRQTLTRYLYRCARVCARPSSSCVCFRDVGVRDDRGHDDDGGDDATARGRGRENVLYRMRLSIGIFYTCPARCSSGSRGFQRALREVNDDDG